MKKFIAKIPGVTGVTISVDAPSETIARLKIQEIFEGDNFIIVEDVPDVELVIIDEE